MVLGFFLKDWVLTNICKLPLEQAVNIFICLTLICTWSVLFELKSHTISSSHLIFSSEFPTRPVCYSSFSFSLVNLHFSLNSPFLAFLCILSIFQSIQSIKYLHYNFLSALRLLEQSSFKGLAHPLMPVPQGDYECAFLSYEPSLCLEDCSVHCILSVAASVVTY